MVELYLACTGNHADIVDTVSRVRFLRIAVSFWTLTVVTASVL